MTDIDKLRADLRAGLPDIRFGAEAFPAQMEVRHLRALLDHIDRVEKDALDWKRWAGHERARAEAAEAQVNHLTECNDQAAEMIATLKAELARLRAPVGEVGEVVKDLEAASADLIQRTFSDRCGSPQCAIASNVATRAADLLTRLAARVAEGEKVMMDIAEDSMFSSKERIVQHARAYLERRS